MQPPRNLPWARLAGNRWPVVGGACLLSPWVATACAQRWLTPGTALPRPASTRTGWRRPSRSPSPTLRDHREAHPLARVFPLLDDVLGQAARDCGAIMAVSDAAGQLLWVCGTPATLRAGREDRLRRGLQLGRAARRHQRSRAWRCASASRSRCIGAEHFRHSVQRWSCAATPIHDPTSSALLGVLDITGGDDIVGAADHGDGAGRGADGRGRARPRAPARAPAQPVESDPGSPGRWSSSLGRHEALLTVDDGRGRPALRCASSPRHSEILLLLASAPHGLSGDELAVLLYEDDGASSTLRAELNRLRHLLGDDLLASRPYRLCAGVAGDWLARRGAARGRRRTPRAARLPRPGPAPVDRARRRPAARPARTHSLRAAVLAQPANPT